MATLINHILNLFKNQLNVSTDYTKTLISAAVARPNVLDLLYFYFHSSNTDYILHQFNLNNNDNFGVVNTYFLSKEFKIFLANFLKKFNAFSTSLSNN